MGPRLNDYDFKAVYRTENDNLLEQFYIPALQRSTNYDRAVGYFSAAMLSYAAQGLSTFVNNEGHIRLIIGSSLTSDEIEAIESGYDRRMILDRLGKEFLASISDIDDDLFFHRLRALSWLVAAGRLDIKVALRRHGMYHEKLGILKDAHGNSIVFQGSANETASALRPDMNFESISVYRSWTEGHDEFAEPYVSGFERLWNGESPNTYIVEFPEAVKNRLLSNVTADLKPPSTKLELYLAMHPKQPNDDNQGNAVESPSIPEFIGASEYQLRDHQSAAIRNWMSNDYQGIFALATGAGKTITAIHAAVRVYEAEKKLNRPLCIVISVPYINLADQWREILGTFNISSIPCYHSKAKWQSRLGAAISALKADAKDYLCIVVVNATLSSEPFQQALSELNNIRMMWIGDECHHHGAEHINKALPKHAKYRIGLSATPEHYIDVDANTRVGQFYGNVVSTYSLTDAITDGVLTPYEYYPVVVDLTHAETEEYLSLSAQIRKLMVVKLSGAMLSSSNENNLQQLLIKRARLIGSAKNKIDALNNLLVNQTPEKHTLFYCGDGSTSLDHNDDLSEPIRQVDVISRVLYDIGWKTSRFTSRESRSTRNNILENFRVGAIDAMVAIRCLDEGIDIPACRTAYLLASSRNPRQFIQRRGRILRRSNLKDHAVVHDFLVRLPSTDDDQQREVERRLIVGEIERVAEFARTSLNPTQSYEELEPLLTEYDLEHLMV